MQLLFNVERIMFTRYSRVVCSVFAILYFFIAGTTMLHASDNDTAKPELVILNWSEYMDTELIKKFEDRHQVKIKQIYFESDDYRDNYMLETQGEGLDLILVNGIQMRMYKQQKWIVPLTEKEIPNLKHIDKKWLNFYEDAEGYAVPYFWGTNGIAYRSDLVEGEIKGWKDMFRLDDALRGKVVMGGSSRDLIGMALKSLGYSLNSTSFKELEEAKQLLLKQKPLVGEYGYVNLDETSTLVTGESYMAMVYSGDALMLQELDENIAYVVPEEGSEIWVDMWTVSKASRNRELAFKFLDFINQPEHAAQIAEFVYYASPNLAAEKLLPDDFKSDEVIYPPKEILDRCEVYKRLPPRVTRFRNEIYSTITQ